MNSARLQIYLDDHLALMVGEAELAARCLKSNRGTPLGDFLDRLHIEIQSQRSIVHDVLHQLEGKPSRVKNSMAWLAEKMGRWKSNGGFLKYSDLSRLVELEALAACASARVSLWETLESVSASNDRLSEISFGFFCEQSEGHVTELQKRRRYAAAQAFSS